MKKKKPHPVPNVETKDTQIRVGIFALGHQNVELFALTKEAGGYFYCRPDDTSLARIKVGIDTKYWDQVLSVLVHEAFEMEMSRIRARYQVSGVSGDSASYTFLFNHTEFCDLCESVGMFLSGALPALSKVYNKHYKTKEKVGT